MFDDFLPFYDAITVPIPTELRATHNEQAILKMEIAIDESIERSR